MDFKTVNYHEFIKYYNIFNAELLNEDNLNSGPNRIKKEVDYVWSLMRILQDKPAYEWKPNISYLPGEIVYFTRADNPDLNEIRRSYYSATEQPSNIAKIPDINPAYWDKITKADILPDFDLDNYVKKTNNTGWIPTADFDPINLKYFKDYFDINIASKLANFIPFDNTREFTPTTDYNATSKKYVDSAIENIKNGTVNNALNLNGIKASMYVRVDDRNKLIAQDSDYNYIRTTTQGFLPGALSSTLGSLTENFKEVHAKDFVGTATRARYADLAEYYNADQNYEYGTVLGVGGINEVTLYKHGMPYAGVVSEKPGLILNDMNTECKTLIALKGRVKVKVSNIVNKGDYIYPDNNGLAKGSKQPKCKDRIGIALTDSFNGYVLVKI